MPGVAIDGMGQSSVQPASDADYWTILLLEESRETGSSGLGGFGALERRVFEILREWRGALAGPEDDDVEDGRRLLGEFEALLRYFAPEVEPPDDGGAGGVPSIDALEATPSGDAVVVPATTKTPGQVELVPLSQLFLRPEYRGNAWLGGGNRFLTGPLDQGGFRSAGRRRAEVDMSGSMAHDVAEWIDAILHFRPGPKTWLSLITLLVLSVVLRLVMRRRPR